ncbi:MAG: hypothetical protein U0414_36475 [Polyangiaceae bacterium]
MKDLLKRFALTTVLASSLAGLTGCDVETPVTGDEDDLTSNTARERNMVFESYVYVTPGSSDLAILSEVKRQDKSAFGALRNANIAANNRELADVDVASFVRENVTLVDPANPKAPGTPMVRVRYRYTDRALVPISMAKRTAVSLAVMHGNYQSQSKRILKECTDNTSHDQEFESAIWYVFNPTLDSCRAAMNAEQAAIDAAHKGLSETQVTKEETTRLYMPITVKLESTKTSTAKTYPEYDQLFSGQGVADGQLVISMISGVMADWAAGEKPELSKDTGYHMYFQQMNEIQKVYPTLKLVSTEGTDLTTFTVGTKTVSGVTWKDLVNWELNNSGWPTNVTSSSERDKLRVAVAAKLAKHWLRFEQPVSVKIGSAAATDLTIVINTYYGAETDDTPHHRALANSDVVIYNGHSYIGAGPLDPNRYGPEDFPSTYQLFMFNSCVSFNYYEQDFFTMHEGGTATLDMITNGLESPVAGSGPSVGRFIGALISGKMSPYKDLLAATANGSPGTDVGVDALRVVDGEVDNTYKPSKKKITLTAK